MPENKKFYVTTPIYFPSGEPHLGHSYSTVAADVIARFKRMQGYDVMFLTGTDEHGQKIELNALKEGKEPKQYVDELVEKFKSLWRILGISNDKFIRTTDDCHEQAVQKIFKNLYDKGEIYKGKYQGWYCTPCESFFTDAQLKGGQCPDCNREVKWAEEEAYFFKLSKYSQKILDHYKMYPSFIQPEGRKNEMIKFIENGLEDLCVSRTSFKWGIPVNFDPAHVVYVWIDALSNYITAQGYGSSDDSDFKKYWPADVHFMSKEIVRFHAVIWPAILMALGLPLPKQVYGHGWILFGDGNKMSKSRGNVVKPEVLCSRYGVDSIRYFLMREIPFGMDGVFSDEALIKRINFDLANDLGNLVSRTLAMVNKYFGGTFPQSQKPGNLDNELIASAMACIKEYEMKMNVFKFSLALGEVWKLISRCNKYIDETMPWELGKDKENHDRLAAVLYNLCEVLRIISILISPVMPQTSKKIQSQLGAGENHCTWEMVNRWGVLPPSTKVSQAEALFPRIDVEKEINELNNLNADKPENKETPSNLINIDDFAKIELITAKIMECKRIDKSKKLLKLLVDDGSGKTLRQVVSGIAEFYTPEELINKNIILVSNLKPVKLCGVESHGMILAATGHENRAEILFAPDLPAGSKIR